MGSWIAESSGVSTHTEEIVVGNDSRENKKKKRRPRKSKQTLSGNLFFLSFWIIYSSSLVCRVRDKLLGF